MLYPHKHLTSSSEHVNFYSSQTVSSTSLWSLICSPMATCVQNNFWKGERGVEDQGDRSQLRTKNHNTHLGLSKNLIIQPADFYYVLNPPKYFICFFFKNTLFLVKLFFVLRRLVIQLLFLSRVQPQKIESPLTFLNV